MWIYLVLRIHAIHTPQKVICNLQELSFTSTVLFWWHLKPYLHVTSAFASNIKNWLHGSKWWCLYLTFQLSRTGRQRSKENANADVMCKPALKLCLHITFACVPASTFVSSLTLCEWWHKCKCREWVPHPFSAFHTTSTWYHRNADAHAHANVTCKQSLSGLTASEWAN